MSAVINATDVSVSFRQGFNRPPLQALDSISLTAGQGEIIGVLGPNGSGKTTLLRVLAGELRPSTGRVEILGTPAASRSLCTRIGYQPEGELPFPNLDARQWLSYLGALLGLSSRQVKDSAGGWLERLDLLHAGRRRVRHFSTGMRKRLALCGALLASPDVLLLDEPTAGLDPQGSLQVMEILQERARNSCTVLLASHDLQEIEQICDRVLLIAKGKCLAEGTLDELLGTGDWSLQMRGLDDAGWQRVLTAVEQAGGTVVSKGRERQHLYALFRDLMR